ncbi:hypothetical protein PIB30_070192 [Stylosanthes scabra]|uniref:Uncharacterized protein n=1 Tax=Stylosanthes scabra TaxID=79078 RepID=A0ABU6SPH2_9FABA|nr:hypothetical protein [Stylosanthes scabra]
MVPSLVSPSVLVVPSHHHSVTAVHPRPCSAAIDSVSAIVTENHHQYESEDGGCWFAWWFHNREPPEPPLRHQEFTVVSSHRRRSLSSPEFIRLPKTKPHPSPDLSSVGLLKFYLVGAAVRTGMMAEFRGRIVVTAELVLAATNAGTNGLGAYSVRVIADLVNKSFTESKDLVLTSYELILALLESIPPC